MQQASLFLSVSDVMSGQAVFSDDMPVWFGLFGGDIWPFIKQSSPEFKGDASSSFVWPDYIFGKGATLNHPNSFSKSKYELCLTSEIVLDLKIAAVIYGYFPNFIKGSDSSKGQRDPKTVKGKIDELANFFSMVIKVGRQRFGMSICRLDQIPFFLVKEVIPTYPGRSSHLKGALKLISDPVIQKNLSAPLQWNLLDITKSSIVWSDIEDVIGIPTLSDAQFLFILKYCKESVTNFKQLVGLDIHDSECRAMPILHGEIDPKTYRSALESYYKNSGDARSARDFQHEFGVSLSKVRNIIRDAHMSALMLILLFTGMRSTETFYLMCDCLTYEYGYWFLKSKVVKHCPKDMPISEGWLAIDITKDVYDILSFICSKTANPYLFSSPSSAHAKGGKGYSGGTLNTKFSRWLKRIDVEGFFKGWNFSIHQCRETLVFQLAKQEVGLPFISMQLKHFHSQFNSMPNAVTAKYGQYRSQMMASVFNRIAEARESSLMDVYGEGAKFAGGGGEAHKVRIDTFFTGLGLFGERRERYIKDMARRGVKLMPTSIGHCTKNFSVSLDDGPPPCYGDLQCDPNCDKHVITERAGKALAARKEHALAEAEKEINQGYKIIWLGLADKLNGHLKKLEDEVTNA